jgi:hypothetical protein
MVRGWEETTRSIQTQWWKFTLAEGATSQRHESHGRKSRQNGLLRSREQAFVPSCRARSRPALQIRTENKHFACDCRKVRVKQVRVDAVFTAEKKMRAARDTTGRLKTTNVLSLATRVDRRVWRLHFIRASNPTYNISKHFLILQDVSKSWFFPNFTSRRPQRRDQEYDALDQGYTPSSAGASSGAVPGPYSSQICRPEN